MDATRSARIFRRLAPILIGSVGLPYLIYLIAHALGAGDVPALALSAIPPAAMTIGTVLRTRRLDVIGALSLAVIAVGIATSFITGNGQFAVAKDSLFNLGLGIAAVASLLVGRPLLLQLIKVLRPDAVPGLDRAWATDADFRAAIRRYTVLWAVVLLLVVVVKLVIAFSLPVGTSLPLLQLLDPVIWIGLIVLTRNGIRPYRAALAA